MHETGVCRSIVDTVERYAIANNAKRVVEVKLVLGEVHDIVPEILADAFEWMCKGGVAEGAKMTIERVPFTVRCQACGEVYPIDYRNEATWDCPACGKRDYRLNTGREFSIASITVEGYAPGEAAAPRACRAPRPLTPARDLAVSGRRPVGSNW